MKAPRQQVLAVKSDVQRAIHLRRVLKPMGFKLTIARTGEQALELIRQRRFDMVITNFNLPGINGLDVCRCLKLDPDLRAIPVIFVDGEVSQYFVNAAFRLGAKDFVHRPYTDGDFRARVLAQLPAPARRVGHKARRKSDKES